jgi:hypothetical protein
MADASYILTNESPIESSMPKNSSSATRVPYLTQIIPTPDQLENNNDDDKERSQKSAIQPKQSTEAFNSRFTKCSFRPAQYIVFIFRRSPPLAIAEQMSESEISDLERKIAGGEFTESLHIDQMVPFGGKMSNESAFNNNRHKN